MGASIDSDHNPLMQNQPRKTSGNTPDPTEYESLVLIMTKSEFDKVQDEYDQIKV